MPNISPTFFRKAKRRDRVARWVIVLGGFTVIGSVLAILLLTVGVTLPLFRPARVVKSARVGIPSDISAKDIVAAGIDHPVAVDALVGYLLLRDGHIAFVDLDSGKVVSRQNLLPNTIAPTSAKKDASLPRLTDAERHAGSRWTLQWSDGSASLAEIKASTELAADGSRSVRYEADILETVPATDQLSATRKTLIRRADNGATTVVRLGSAGQIVAQRWVVSENLLGEKERPSRELSLDATGVSGVTQIAIDRDGATIYAGTWRGLLVRWVFDDDGELKFREIVHAFADQRQITSLAMVFGDVSLAVGDSEGGVSTWFPVRYGEKTRLTQVHTLSSHRRPIRAILPSGRSKTLLSVSDEGTIHLDHATSERVLARFGENDDMQAVGFSARGDAILIAGGDDLRASVIDAPHPEVSWKTLFGKVFYEGYDEPVYAWQTTGGDDFEAKLSLVPLLSGTLKGAFYAMLFAVPLALFGAVYTSHFTTPAFKQVIKPLVEIMAAIPSVVIGFLIALWLAPKLERWLLIVFLSGLTLPVAFVAFMAVWQSIRKRAWAKRVECGYEFLALVPVLILGIGLAMLLAPAIESAAFGGDFRQWLNDSLGMRYDQRNCIVIAFGLGFAVIPIIFSIADDSLSSVPRALTASSMALGASRWQTLWRVILPSASPGIFAGVMIGFGRAVGETMIVLMATGNTPILDWSPLNGMRTLSANIAVEIPESPVGGTLYRVLFLCAVLLFLLTFCLNTVAELVRQRLRQRYGRL
jgi:phosphate transport system permease protein